MQESGTALWHAALAYAVTGCRWDLGRQVAPDVDAVVALIRLRASPEQRMGPPHQVPADLMDGIGAAQFHAASAQVRDALAPASGPPPVVADRALSADERRLLADVPPHHGS